VAAREDRGTEAMAVGSGAGEEKSYLRDVLDKRGLGSTRRLLLRILERHRDLFGDSILEVGAGMPDFLLRVPVPRRAALDVEPYYADSFREAGIAFHLRDLDRQDLDDLGPFDIVVCTDVFEHLLHPEKALARIQRVMSPKGVLFSHVPNEFRLGKMLRVMLGREESVYWHADQPEWGDPHLRRFTDLGYRRFLSLAFRHNLRLNALKPSRYERPFNRLGLRAPYCLQAGPTYLSTNDAGLAAEFRRRAGRRARFM